MDERLLTSPYVRKVFFVTALASLFVILTLRLFLLTPSSTQLPSDSPNLIDDALALTPLLLDSLLAAIVVTVSLATLLLWISGSLALTSRFQVLDPHDIGTALAQSRTDTRTYWFGGALGRYTRSITLPYLAQEATSTNTTKYIHIQILDPSSSSVCSAYANYRSRVWSGRSAAHWSSEEVALEAYATIACAFAFAATHRLLSISITLKPNISLNRLDLSDKAAILTSEDPRAPALSWPNNTHFYNVHREDLQLQSEQNRTVDISAQLSNITQLDLSPDSLTAPDVRAILDAVDLDSHSLNDHSLEAIAELATARRNPYG